MIAFQKKEKDSSKILAFTESKGATMDMLRAMKGEVAKRNNLPLESVSMRYIKQERRQQHGKR